MKKSIVPSPTVVHPKVPTATTPNRILNSTMAVASLKRLSPSTRIANLLGAPTSLNSAITATGSVAAISAPKRSAGPHPMGVNRKTSEPTIPVESSSPGTANESTGARFCDSNLPSRA